MKFLRGEGILKPLELPPYLRIDEAHRLLVWVPRGVMNEAVINKIIAFLSEHESRPEPPFDRVADFSRLETVDLNFNYIFHVSLYRRLSAARRGGIKSAFIVTGGEPAHYAKLHAMLTDRAPLRVAIFDTRESAAEWLGVPVEVLAEGEESEA